MRQPAFGCPPNVLLALAAVVLLSAAAWPPVGGVAAHSARDVLASSAGFASPTYGYRLTWDPAMWERVETRSGPGPDSLLLGHDQGRITVELEGYEDGAGNHVSCLRGAAERIERYGWTLQPSALPVPKPGAAASSAIFEGEPGLRDPRLDAFYVECRTLVPRRAVLRVTAHLGYDEDEYREGVALFEALMANLELPDRTRSAGEWLTPGGRPADVR